MNRAQFSPLLAPLAWTLYIALPVAGWGWLNGVPLGVLEAGAIALVWWSWAADRALPGARALAVLTAAKLLIGLVLVDDGFAARYYANDSWTPPVERSAEFRRGDITRHDTRLAFGGPGQPDLPLHFLNDLRFNYFRSDQPQRTQLAYSVIWEGALRADDAGANETFYLSAADGLTAELTIDDRVVVALNGMTERTGEVALSPGWHTIRVRAAASYGSGRHVEAGEVVNGSRRPFDRRHVLIAPVGTTRLVLDGAARWLSRAADLAVLAWLAVLAGGRAWAAWQHRRIGRVLWLGAIAEALWFGLPYAGRVSVLTGGDDWLTYEHLARAIVEDPLLQQPGPGAGQGTAFYFQPFYPYFLAATHLIFGDSLFGAVVVQRVLVAAATAWTVLTTRRFFGDRVARFALLGGGLFLYVKLGRWSDVMLAESLFTPLLVGWAYMLIKAASPPVSAPWLLFTGAIGGIATLTRTTLFVAWPVVVPVWAGAIRERRLRATALLLAAMLAVVGMLTVRTWLVTGAVALAPTSGGVALFVGNQPPPSLAPAPAGRDAAYERLRLAPLTRAVVEYSLQQPSAFAANLGRKALYAVGLFDLSAIDPTGAPVPGASLFYLAVWAGAIAAAIRVIASPAPPALGALVWLPALLALSHFAMMIVFLPNVYGDRQILPLYPLLLPYAALAFEPVARWMAQHVGLVSAMLLGALSVLIFLPASQRVSDLVMFAIAAAAVLALTARPAIAPADRVMCAGIAAAFVAVMAAHAAWFDGSVEIRRYLALPVAACAIGQLARANAVQRIALAALIVGPFVTAVAIDRAATVHLADPFVWIVVAVAALAAALLGHGPRLTRRAAAAVAVGCVALAVLVPVGADADIAEEVADIRRGLPALTRGDAAARREFMADVQTTAGRLAEPFRAAGGVLTGGTVAFSLACLCAAWTLAALLRRSPARGPGAGAAVTAVILAAGMIAAALAGPRVPPWGGSGYPLAALAILVGLAHARFQVTEQRPRVSVTEP